MFYYRPDSIMINLKIQVNKNVSYTVGLLPWNIRMKFSEVLRYSTYSLTNNLKMTHNPRLYQFILIKGFFSLNCILLDISNGLLNIL